MSALTLSGTIFVLTLAGIFLGTLLAVQVSNELAQTRFLLFVESENLVPSPFLAVLALRATAKRSRKYMRSASDLPVMEQSMTSAPDTLLPSAKEVMQKLALAEAEEAEKEARMRAEAAAEKKALIDQLMKPSGISDEEAIGRGMKIIERAIKNRMTEVEVFRFPHELCTDYGRAVNQQEPGWEKTLTGAPKEIYELWQKYFRPRGYKLKVQVVDFPDGLPGDIGMTLSWA